MLVIFLLVLILFLVIVLFAFPQFSPIPYFPTNNKDIDLIIKTLHLKDFQTIIDLGAGDGTVIFAAAQEALKHNLNTEFIAIDINPILILIMYIKRFLHPNKKSIQIIRSDMFKMDFKTINHELSTTIYLYISPWYLEKVIENLKFLPAGRHGQISNFDIVSYMYPIKSLKKTEKVIKGIRHNIFRYNVG